MNRLHFIDGVLEQAGPEKLDAILAGAEATIEVLALLERAAPDIQAQRLPQRQTRPHNGRLIMMKGNTPMLELQHIKKTYHVGDTETKGAG